MMTSSTNKALDSKHYRAAIAGYTKAIEWERQTCGATIKNAGNSIHREQIWKSYWHRAEAYAGLGDYARASDDLSLCLIYGRDDWFKPDGLAWAIKILNGAMKRQPRNALFRRARAQAYLQQKEFQLALTDINAAIDLAKTKQMRGEAYADRRWIYVKLNKPDLAFKDITKAIETAPKPDPYWLKLHAKHLQEIGQLQGAIDDYTKALRLFSPDYDKLSIALYRLDRARLYRQNHQFDKASRDLSKVLASGYPETSPIHKDSLREQVLLLVDQGRTDQANATLAKLEKLGDSYAKSAAFACKMAEAKRRQAGKNVHAPINPKELRRVWRLGEIVIVIPLRHLISGPDPKSDKLWADISNFVRRGQQKAGLTGHGLDPLPTLKGNKIARLRQTIGFIFRQKKIFEDLLTKETGESVSAVFSISATGNLFYALNRIGVPNLNGQLLQILKTYGPKSVLPCDVWQKVADMPERPQASYVKQLWDEAKKSFEQFVSKS